jgi:uncharacterized protein
MQRELFLEIARANPINRRILERLPALDLRDPWLVSGSLFQTVWNAITGRDLLHGIKDYDIFYFDPDLSWEAEDRVIRRSALAFADLSANVEVRNQARVHLWYPAKFGTDYPPLRSTTEGIDRFLAIASMVGVKPQGADFAVYAPHGFADIAAMVVRPNRRCNFRRELYENKAGRWKALWPEPKIVLATD